LAVAPGFVWRIFTLLDGFVRRRPDFFFRFYNYSYDQLIVRFGRIDRARWNDSIGCVRGPAGAFLGIASVRFDLSFGGHGVRSFLEMGLLTWRQDGKAEKSLPFGQDSYNKKDRP
jgi:hypothetical protein